MDKIYIVVHASLTSGQKMAQACHAYREFWRLHPDKDQDTLVILEHCGP